MTRGLPSRVSEAVSVLGYKRSVLDLYTEGALLINALMQLHAFCRDRATSLDSI